VLTYASIIYTAGINEFGEKYIIVANLLLRANKVDIRDKTWLKTIYCQYSILKKNIEYILPLNILNKQYVK